MNLQERKISFVKEILRVNDTSIFDRLEDVLHSEKERVYNQDISPMSLDDFNDRIDKAEYDYNNKRLINVNTLSNEIEQWV
jgi:hypothetical protein